MKEKQPSKFNKTRHSNQEGSKTALAFWKFPKNKYKTEKHPVIISKVKCASKVETILSFQEKQMLDGVVNAVQSSQRDAIRIALYELSKTPLEAPLRLAKYASKESQEKGHTSRSCRVTAKLPRAEKTVFDELPVNCKLTSKETVRLAIIWLAISVKNEDFKLTKSPRVSQKKLAREWSKTYDKETGSKLTALTEASDAAYEKAKDEAEERREEEYERRGEILKLMRRDGTLQMWSSFEEADQNWKLDPQIIDNYGAMMYEEQIEKQLEESGLDEREKEIERIKASFPSGTDDDELANDIHDDDLKDKKEWKKFDDFIGEATDEELIDEDPSYYFSFRRNDYLDLYDSAFETEEDFKRKEGETADEYFNRAFPPELYEKLIKERNEKREKSQKEIDARLEKKHRRLSRKFRLDLTREQRIMKQEQRCLDLYKNYLKGAEEKKDTKEIEQWKAVLDERLKWTQKEVIKYWDDTHPDLF